MYQVNKENVIASLRTRSLENKVAIVAEVEKNVWPAIAQGKVKPVIYKSFLLSEEAQAHQLIETTNPIGKDSSSCMSLVVYVFFFV
ncbi:NADPH:quinone reductase [Ranunculus cassubicifolius]